MGMSKSLLLKALWLIALMAAPAAPGYAMTSRPSMPIQSSGSGLCIDVAGQSKGASAGIVQIACGDTASQGFRFEPLGNGAYQIVNRNSGLCVDVPQSSRSTGTQLIQWGCSQAANQQWQVAGNGDGSSFTIKSLSSGLCLAVANAQMATAAAIVQDTCSGGAFRAFVIGGGVAFLPDQPAAIQALNSGLCINVWGGGNGDNVRIAQWMCDGGGNSRWSLKPVGAFYQLVAQHSGKCLTVPFGSNADGANLVQYACRTDAGQDDQLFALAPDPSGDHYKLVAKRSGRCVDVNGVSTLNGANIIQWPCINQRNQSFNLVQPAKAATWANGPQLDLVAAAAANLPNGKIMFWSASNQYDFPNLGRTYTSLFDPAAAPDKQLRQTLVTATGHDMFCPGTTLLADGTLLVNGGNSNTQTSLYNPATDSWATLPRMTQERGYQANTILPNGAVLTVGGNWSASAHRANNGEVYVKGNWKSLPGIDTTQMATADAQDQGTDFVYRADNHMWLIPVSGGRILHAGPSKAMHWISTQGSGGITSAGMRGGDADAMNGTAVLYDGRRILTNGGGVSYQDVDATPNANLIDTAPTNPAVTALAPMNYPRAYHNDVVLPNGQVVVIGGMTHPIPFTDDTAVLPAEVWDPGLETFQVLPAMQTPRTYHGIALLMMDGRVMVTGGGLCGNGCIQGWINNHPNTEILTPPYLYDSNGRLKTNRPAITAAPKSANAGATLAVTTAAPVSAFSLVRFGADTHTVNNDQRRIPLTFNASGTNYTLQLPADTSVLLPGYYMLFAMDAAGTPSVAVSVKINVTAA